MPRDIHGSLWPKTCATCGYPCKTPGDELRHIHWHMGYASDEARYRLIDQRELPELSDFGNQ